jgi:outer membrane protein OmpA-like peptidoglycan-associated protein/tetratricopeptide (TPR) repeat protein
MRLLLFLLLTLPILDGVAQNDRSVRSLKEEADRYYEDEQYNLAIQDYRELADQNVKDAEVNYRLAECYRKTFNYTEAEAYYLKVYFLSPSAFPLSLYYFALMLKFNGNFDESLQYFTEFIRIHEIAGDLKEFVEQAFVDRSGCQTAKEELTTPHDSYPGVAIKLNTAYNDFAPAVKDSITVVISSGRIFSNRQSIDERFGEAFTDNYYFEKVNNAWIDRTKQMFGITNSKFNDGSGCFNSNGDKYYYTVCGMEGPHCRIFVTELKGQKWTEPVPLNTNINLKSYEARQPAISHGGDSLIFATNRPGGSGGFDLWMSINAGNDNWGPAMNLGISVNTKLNELSPAFTSFPNVLFFSSDGHEGYGGLDLYMSKRLSTGETILYNLGSPFNSNRDDCFVTFSEHEVYWSSNRQEGLGGFDIMAVKISSVPAFISKLSLKKRNSRRDISLRQKTEEAQRLSLQASILEEKIDYENLTYEKKKIVDQLVQSIANNTTARSDQFNIDVAEFEQLNQIAQQRYNDIKRHGKEYLARVSAPANKGDEMVVTGILVDSLTNLPLHTYKVLLTEKQGEVIKITKTNEEGKFRFTGLTSGEFYLRLEKSGNNENVVPVVRAITITSDQTQQTVQLENIYFDFDHYRMRPEAVKVLDELASYLMSNVGAQLEIFAFADDRGTNEYNIKLTQKRGQSVAEYLTRKGVDQTGIAIVAKGKQAQREVDVDLQRQFNRRVEFYLNGEVGPFNASARTYILRKAVDWKTLANITGTPLGTLKELNGSKEEQLHAFQPVRLPAAIRVVSDEFFFKAL